MAAGTLTERTWSEDGAWDFAAAALPEGVEAILAARLSMLSSEARAVLRVLALVTRPSAPALIAASAALDRDLCLSVLADLTRRELCKNAGRGRRAALRYRQAIASPRPRSPSRPQRNGARCTRASVDAIEALPERLSSDWILDLAHHAIRAQDAERAAPTFQAAALQEALYAWDRATEVYDALLSVPGLPADVRVETLLRLARIASEQGDPKGAMRRLAAAYRIAHLELDAARGKALHQAGAIAFRRGQRFKAEARAVRALEPTSAPATSPGSPRSRTSWRSSSSRTMATTRRSRC
ncbi:MAG: hypothetical protein U0166_10500 [Acidobacteriota bacterium]